MGIVNHTYYPYIYSTPKETRIDYKTESGGYWSVKDWRDGNDYWYCAIFHNNEGISTDIDTVDFLKLIPNEILTDDSIFIVLCTEFEAFTDIVEPIYKNLIQKLNINPKRIILISENADACAVVKKVAANYNLDTINVEWSRVHEKSVQIQYIESNFIATGNMLEKKSYPKAFLNFNQRWRLHRPCLVALLYCMNLLNKGFVSLGKSSDGNNWNTTFDAILKLIEEDNELYSLLLTNKNNILNLPELYLDTTNLISGRCDVIHSDINHTETIKLYENSYFSVVSETNFFGHTGRFLSEKTFKPILYKHPFILLCDPYSLTLLRKLGYKTFHPFIDESYDNESNDVRRLKMILNEVNRLSNLTEIEIFEFIDNVKEITIHNHNIFISKTKFNYSAKIL